jgi:hypothetical protein
MGKFHLFLDFDGLLVTKFSVPSKRFEGMEFDLACIETLGKALEYLRELFDEVIVVIISNWRFELPEKDLVCRLQEHNGIHRHVLGIEVLGKRGGKRADLLAYIDQRRLPSAQHHSR